MPSPSSSTSSPSRSRKTSSISRSSTTTQQQPRTEIIINVYDLLPPGRLSSLLWTIGGSLLHTGVVVKGREYAYGGHNKRGVTGVYWTKPRYEPPGGTWRCEVLQGFTFRSESEIEGIIKEVSDTFLGPSYNLLTHNCNHFTSALCSALTSKPAPPWVNRAASIGLALPCMVPREWVTPPDHETAEGELVDEGDEHNQRDHHNEEDGSDDEEEGWGDEADEQSGMLDSDKRRDRRQQQQGRRGVEGNSLAGGKRLRPRDETPPARVVKLRDSSGRDMPVAERAPLPSNSGRKASVGMS